MPTSNDTEICKQHTASLSHIKKAKIVLKETEARREMTVTKDEMLPGPLYIFTSQQNNNSSPPAKLLWPWKTTHKYSQWVFEC